ncbi:MAG: TetR/AcrR family transcriptional regulator [Propionibacteriaceae bacterium]|nr:TetR/AcrR family transcriptional regulator [Propionibacteriaceae bacterium]
MRTNKRARIIDEAIGIIEARGVEALSFESLAEAARLSKSGILYHFRSRHDLLLAINQHFVDQSEAELIALAGAPAAEATAAQRLRAVVQHMGANANRAELLMCLEADAHPEFRAQWARLDEAWMPSPESASTSPDATAAYLVQLMAYGLWAHDHLHHAALSPAAREQLIEAVLASIPDQ